MKRRWYPLALLLALAVSLTACQVEFIPRGQPENNGSTTIDTPPLPGGNTDPVDVTDPVGGDEEPSGGSTDYTMEKYRRYLEGEWAGVEGEIEGDRYKLADEEISLPLPYELRFEQVHQTLGGRLGEYCFWYRLYEKPQLLHFIRFENKCLLLRFSR